MLNSFIQKLTAQVEKLEKGNEKNMRLKEFEIHTIEKLKRRSILLILMPESSLFRQLQQVGWVECNETQHWPEKEAVFS